MSIAENSSSRSIIPISTCSHYDTWSMPSKSSRSSSLRSREGSGFGTVVAASLDGSDIAIISLLFSDYLDAVAPVSLNGGRGGGQDFRSNRPHILSSLHMLVCLRREELVISPNYLSDLNFKSRLGRWHARDKMDGNEGGPVPNVIHLYSEHPLIRN